VRTTNQLVSRQCDQGESSLDAPTRRLRHSNLSRKRSCNAPAQTAPSATTMDHIGFDPASMNYVATALQHPGSADPFSDMLMQPPMVLEDQHSGYGFAGGESMGLHSMQQQQPQQATPSLKRAYSTFEDPFSDVVSAFEHTMHNEQNEVEAPSIDRDNKLLGFSLPRFDYRLLTYNYQRTSIQLAAQLHGMFFLAESPWAAAGDAQPPPSELTCYRRNLFQITGEITIPRSLRYIMTDQGEQIPIMGQELVVSATESTENNPVKIISVPWKTPANPVAPTAEDKAEREPPAVPIDLMNMQDMDSEFVTMPFQWKRLQFRIATANNGRRKELQQHFLVKLKVVATLATGGKIPICEVQSGAIIVRGRSPRNFQARKDLPLSGGGHARKTSHAPPRSASGESTNKRIHTEAPPPTSAPIKPEASSAPPPAAAQKSLIDPNDIPTPIDFFNWKPAPPESHQHQHQQQGSTSALPPQTAPVDAPMGNNMYAASNPDLHNNQQQHQHPPTTAPINLSLLEEDSPLPPQQLTPTHPRHRSGSLAVAVGAGEARAGAPAFGASDTGARQGRSNFHIPVRPPSFSLNTINSPDESADLLYEYFPLGLDDWMPPVDAVYRPHVVHHTKLPSDPRDLVAGKARSRRLYSADVIG
jgi:hypothetical protein